MADEVVVHVRSPGIAMSRAARVSSECSAWQTALHHGLCLATPSIIHDKSCVSGLQKFLYGLALMKRDTEQYADVIEKCIDVLKINCLNEWDVLMSIITWSVIAHHGEVLEYRYILLHAFFQLACIHAMNEFSGKHFVYHDEYLIEVTCHDLDWICRVKEITTSHMVVSAYWYFIGLLHKLIVSCQVIGPHELLVSPAVRSLLLGFYWGNIFIYCGEFHLGDFSPALGL